MHEQGLGFIGVHWLANGFVHDRVHGPVDGELWAGRLVDLLIDWLHNDRDEGQANNWCSKSSHWVRQ